MSESEDTGRFGLTRRTLLQASGATAGMAALSGCLGIFDDEEELDRLGDAETAYGNCWMCCHDCSQEVKVNDGTVVDITGVDGNPRGSAGPGTEGTLCPKGLNQLDKTHDPDRIKQPYIREDGELREADWDEAFEYAAERLAEFDQEHGSETFLNAASWAETPIHEHIFNRLYGTPERITRGVHVCAGPTFVAGGMMGVGSNNRFPDYQNCEYIIAWGRNVMEAFGGQFEPKGVLEAIENNGATLVTIDPQHTETVQKSDIWLPIKPRTDGALALAMAHVIIEEGLHDEEFIEEYTYGFESYREAVEDKTPEWAEDITGIEAEKIREVAIGFAEAAPQAGISMWTGIAQMGNGWKNAQNITALNGLVGNIDREGGLRMWREATPADPFDVQNIDLPPDARDEMQPALQRYDEYEEYPVRHVERIAHNLVPEMVENGHINGIYCHHDMPQKDGNAQGWLDALEEMDLVIVTEAYWSELVEQADVVFADATQLEKNTLGTGSWSAYSNHTWITGGQAAVEPQWDTKPDFEILVELARAMGRHDHFDWDEDDYFSSWLDEDGTPDHELFIDDQLSKWDMTLEDLSSGGANFQLIEEFDYEQWQEEDNVFQFDLDQIPPFVNAAEQAGMDTAPEYIPPGTYGDELSEEYPLEFFDTRAVYFSHGSDQGLDRLLARYAERHGLEDEDYRGNYLVINPRDADERGIETGDMVTLESEAGSGELMAYVSERTQPGFVTAEYGFGEGSIQHDEEGMNTMKIHEKQMDPITGQPDRHVAVDVRKGGD